MHVVVWMPVFVHLSRLLSDSVYDTKGKVLLPNCSDDWQVL